MGENLFETSLIFPPCRILKITDTLIHCYYILVLLLTVCYLITEGHIVSSSTSIEPIWLLCVV